jgi:voltage-gated potassium channel
VDGAAHTSRSPAAGAAQPAPDVAWPERHLVFLAVLRTLVTLGGVLALYLLLPLNREFSAGTIAVLGAGVLAMGLLVTWQVRAILHAPHPALRAVEAVASSLTLFLLLFAGTYVVLSGSDPGAFTEPLDRVDGLYFVVTVFATVGFGDVSAVSKAARVLVTMQMVGDLVLIGLVLRVFVTAIDRGRRRTAGQESRSAVR